MDAKLIAAYNLQTQKRKGTVP